jgi:pimeloyl-ACP methyl ester carboxylesterase
MQLLVSAALVALASLVGFWSYRGEVDLEPAALEAQYGKAPSQYVQLPSGTRVRYQDNNPAANGAKFPALLLLHGGGLSLESWAPLVEKLAGTMRIVTVDLPGQGLTGTTVEGDYSADGMVRFVSEFTAVTMPEGPFVLGGHGAGGEVAWRFALRHPERVSKLVLVAPAGIAPPAGPQAAALTIADMPGGGLILRLYNTRQRFQSTLRAAAYDKPAITNEIIDRAYLMSRREGTRAATLARLQSADADPAPTARLAEIKVPTLLLWGREDPVFPIGQASAFAGSIAGAKLVTYERCGHFPMIERPDATASDVKSFLAGG